MLHGDGNENNWSNKRKKEEILHVQHTFLYISLPLLLLDYNLKRYTFYGGNQCRMCSTKSLLFMFLFAFFHCRSFLPYWPLAFLITFSHRRYKIFIVLSTKFVSFVFFFFFFYLWL